jgi:hypothetical protein
MGVPNNFAEYVRSGGNLRIAPWVATPGVKAKLTAKLTELERELDRTRAAIQQVRNQLLVHTEAAGTPATATRAAIPPPLQRGVEELEGWVLSIVESMTYVRLTARNDAGLFRDNALAAMLKGDKRATADMRAAGVAIPDTDGKYYRSGVMECDPPPPSHAPSWAVRGY